MQQSLGLVSLVVKEYEEALAFFVGKLGFELIEVVVHGWDIARSLDVPPPFDDDVVAAALAGARAWVDDSVRTPQLFGPEVTVADDAPVLDRLVGFLGRDPTARTPFVRGARP